MAPQMGTRVKLLQTIILLLLAIFLSQAIPVCAAEQDRPTELTDDELGDGGLEDSDLEDTADDDFESVDKFEPYA